MLYMAESVVGGMMAFMMRTELSPAALLDEVKSVMSLGVVGKRYCFLQGIVRIENVLAIQSGEQFRVPIFSRNIPVMKTFGSLT